jgi:dimethylaniline monooxygenase (N-oxide forming)
MTALRPSMPPAPALNGDGPATARHARGDRVCVIGAGASGIAMCRALAQREIPFDCFERSDRVGGLWRHRSGVGACGYESLHANTSRTVMQFPSYPMPADYPHYPHNRLVADYFDDFVDHHGFRDRIVFASNVTSVSPGPHGGWHVSIDGGAPVHYRAVAVASGGRHATPRVPTLEGTFTGRQIHAFEYDQAEEFAGQNVVVIGLGATAADIATEVSRVAAATFLSVRTGHYVVPKLIEGRPVDELSPFMRRLSPEMRRPLLTLMLKLVHGDPTAYGLPKPPYKPGQGPLVASSELLPAIAHGGIVAKPQIESLDGRRVRFSDASEHAVDAIISCTGYDIGYSFMDVELGITPDDAPPLYHQAVPPGVEGLYFIGLLHSMMALMPLADAQADWVGDLLTGEVSLPPEPDMWSTIRAARRRQDRRFYDSSGHLLVDPVEYTTLLERERSSRRPGRRLLAGSRSPWSA